MNQAKKENAAIVPRTATPPSHEGYRAKSTLANFLSKMAVNGVLTLSCRYWGTPRTFPSITATVPQVSANHSLSKQRSVKKIWQQKRFKWFQLQKSIYKEQPFLLRLLCKVRERQTIVFMDEISVNRPEGRSLLSGRQDPKQKLHRSALPTGMRKV